MSKKENKLFVEREIYEKNDKTFFTYFVRGVLRGKEIKIAVVPPDIGGYAALDIVFGDEMKGELIVTPFEIKDEKTGRVFKGNTLSVRNVDENGEVYECNIKPFRSSDKALLSMLLK